MATRAISHYAQLTPRSVITCVVMAVAMVLGGGGTSAPGSELLLELATALGAGAWLLVGRYDDGRCARHALILAALVLALPVLQLVPLPPAVWHGLSGRANEIAGLDLVGAGRSWMPWTISPPRTWASLLATLPAAFVLCAVSCLDRRGRTALLATIAVVSVISLLLGALQLADGSERTWRFYVDNPGYLNGFQANRNAEVDVLLIALAAVVGVLAPRHAEQGWTVWRLVLAVGGGTLLLLGCVLTGSRAGILIAVAVTPVLVRRHLPHGVLRRRPIAIAAIVAVVGGCIVLAQSPPGALRQVADRFTGWQDVRADLWRDTLPALRSAWPAGSGVGTFRPMFVATEPLTSVDPTRPVRAHNDYLEFALEGGVAAIAVLAGCATILGRALLRAIRHAATRDRPTVTFAAVTFAIFVLHSLVDYPLRSMALAVLGAAASGLLFAVLRDADRHDRARDPGLELSRG